MNIPLEDMPHMVSPITCHVCGFDRVVVHPLCERVQCDCGAWNQVPPADEYCMRNKIPLKDIAREETDLENDILWIDCPVCKGKPDDGLKMIEHAISVPFALEMKSGYKNTICWNKAGNLIDSLSVTPSIRVLDGCGFHAYITNGVVEYWID